jgi:stage III sporulation protein AD
MDIFIKATGAVLVALILTIVLSKQGKDFSLLITVLVCTIISIAALNYISPLIDFFENLQSIGKLDSTFIQILLRSVGIGLLAEISSLICTDAGNAALGKTLQLLAGVVVLWMSVPLFTNIIELIEEILVSV